MYENIFLPVQSLQKAPAKTGGLCSVKIFKWEDVLVWPAIDPLTGVCSETIQMKPGTSIYMLAAVDKGRSFEEDEKTGDAGSYFDIEVNAILAGSMAANTLSLRSMRYHKWGLIVEDRSGETRLIGNEDSGADLIQNYNSGDISVSRRRQLKWKWQHPQSAPIYTAEAFTITIGGSGGGVTITAGCITLIMRFRVGDPGAAMAAADTTLTRAAFANKKLLVLAGGGFALPVDDSSGDIDWSGSIERHIEKTLAGDTITYVGGVTNKEIIEIYAFS